jgi:hypothetical protein
MVAYAYDTIERRNPLGFFGMVFVLEGTSVALALNAADRIQHTLQLPTTAFSYLRSHGELDQEHVVTGRHPRKMTEVADREAIRRARHLLHSNVFRGLGSRPRRTAEAHENAANSRRRGAAVALAAPWPSNSRAWRSRAAGRRNRPLSLQSPPHAAEIGSHTTVFLLRRRLDLRRRQTEPAPAPCISAAAV